MRFIEQLQVVSRIHYLILKKGTGPPVNFANRLGISRASLFRYLELFKAYGAQIDYCNYRLSYFYEEPFDISSFLMKAG